MQFQWNSSRDSVLSSAEWQLTFRNAPVVSSTPLRLQYDFITTSLRIYYESITTSLRLYYDFSTTLLRLYYDSTTTPLRLHFDSNTTPVRLHFNSITTPLRLHRDFITTPVRLHYDSDRSANWRLDLQLASPRLPTNNFHTFLGGFSQLPISSHRSHRFSRILLIFSLIWSMTSLTTLIFLYSFQTDAVYQSVIAHQTLATISNGYKMPYRIVTVE